jgi:hypothetical protein
LYKAFGLRFIITVTGSAGLFNIVPFLLKVSLNLTYYENQKRKKESEGLTSKPSHIFIIRYSFSVQI